MVAHGSRKRWKEDRHWGLGSDGKGSWKPKAFRWDSDADNKLELYAKMWRLNLRPTSLRIYFSGAATINVSVKDVDGTEIGADATYESGDSIALTFGDKNVGKLIISAAGAFNVTHIDHLGNLLVSTTTSSTTTTTT